MANGTSVPSPVKDAIDTNSGRFEFLKQTLTLGSAGIAGIAALFTDPSRIPSDVLSKLAILVGAVGLAIVVAYATMGLSTYANLLTITASDDPEVRKRAPTYVRGLRDHARIVILGLAVAFFGIGLFALYRLFFASNAGTVEAALDTAVALVSRETKQPQESLSLVRMEAEADAYTVAYSIPAANSQAIVRISRKDGSVIRMVQNKTP
jgi:hypothetical protein